MAEVVTRGMPEVGWEGDPFLELSFDPVFNRWIITDMLPEKPQIVWERPYGGLRDLDYRDMCSALKRAKQARGVNKADEIIDNEKRLAERFHREMQEVSDYAARELQKAFSHYDE